MTTDEIEDFFARWEEAFFVRRDATATASYYATDAVVESPISGHLVGRTAIEANWRSVLSTFTDLRTERKDLLIRSHDVVWTAELSGSDTGGMLGQAATYKPFRVFVVFLCTVDQQQIVRERRVYDIHGLLMQLGSDLGTADTAQAYRATLERTRAEHELRIAGEIQQALMPERQHKEPGLEIAATSIPCRAIGGDFVDYFSLPTGAFAFVLGDVAGKRPPAALLAARLQGMLAVHADSALTASETLTRINEELVRRTVESKFATIFYGVLCEGHLSYSSGGHNPALIIGRSGVRRLDRGGVIVGAFRDVTFEEETVKLDAGDVVVVFSDGISEARNRDGSEFGEERLLSAILSDRESAPGILLNRVVAAVQEFGVGAEQSDDLTALILRYTGS